jgi:hypothetical protein
MMMMMMMMILYYLRAEPTATRPITDTAQGRYRLIKSWTNII